MFYVFSLPVSLLYTDHQEYAISIWRRCIDCVDGGIEKAMNLEKSTLRAVKDRTEDQVMPYVSTHNPKNPEIYNVIQFNLPILHEIKK